MMLLSPLANLAPWVTLLAVGVQCGIAWCVYRDAHARRLESPESVKMLTPEMWGLACLFGSIPALAVYWAAPHSTLAK
jgi:hypothetical protein